MSRKALRIVGEQDVVPLGDRQTFGSKACGDDRHAGRHRFINFETSASADA